MIRIKNSEKIENMKFITPETAEKVPFNLDGRKMFTNEKTELIHITLKPQEEIELHANPFDVVFYILEGSPEVLLENQSSLASPNSLLFIEKDKQRGLRNNSNENVRVLVVKIF